MIPPKVFVSYSHDSAEHKEWVLNFATTLRNRGIDAILDQWDLSPGDDVPEFMEQSLATCDFAIMVCTKRYVEKADAGTGGVGYEKMIMTQQSLSKISDNNVIPVIREHGTPSTPTFLGTKLFVDFSKDADVEFALDDLIRHLLGAPLYKKPEVGKNPFTPLDSARPDKTADGVMQAMTAVAQAFDEETSTNVSLSKIMRHTTMRRLTMDKYLKAAVNQGLINQNTIGGVSITDEGLDYLETHEILVD